MLLLFVSIDFFFENLHLVSVVICAVTRCLCEQFGGIIVQCKIKQVHFLSTNARLMWSRQIAIRNISDRGESPRSYGTQENCIFIYHLNAPNANAVLRNCELWTKYLHYKQSFPMVCLFTIILFFPLRIDAFFSRTRCLSFDCSSHKFIIHKYLKNTPE